MSEPTASVPLHPVPFGRRLAVVAVLSFAITIALSGVDALYATLEVYRVIPVSNIAARLFVRLAIELILLGAAFQALRQMQARLLAGEPKGLVTMPEQRLILMLFALVVVSRIVPHVWVDPEALGGAREAYNPVFGTVYGFVTSLLECLLWIWWCNCPPRRERLAGIAALGWIGFQLFTGVLQFVVPTFMLFVTSRHLLHDLRAAISLPGSALVINPQVSAPIFSLGSNVLSPQVLLGLFLPYLLVPVCAGFALTLYAMSRGGTAPAPAPPPQ